MQNIPRQYAKQWWAEGDTPVRTDSRVTYLVDGRTAMLEMCRHFIKARTYIYLANWGVTADIPLVRGKDCYVGPDDRPDQAALLTELRAEGFQEADIAFWRQGKFTLQAVLGYAVSKGVEVKALPWKASELFSHYSPKEAQEQLSAVGVTCVLDDSSLGIMHHPIESLHQKIAVVDGTHAFVGGVDLLIERGGEYDRWDTPDHLFADQRRRKTTGDCSHPWHDAHAIIEGPAASDVELNFRQRWNDVIQRHHMDERLLIPQHPLPPPLQTKSVVQIARTIPEHTYKFLPPIIQGIAQLYRHALSNIQQFAYLENQYLWLRAYYGVDVSILGTDSPEMEQNLRLLEAALLRGAFLSIILPDHPNVGRGFTDAAIAHLRTAAPQAEQEGRIQAFCLATSTQGADGRTEYRPIYVHAKVAIVDGIWSTVGSGNLNNRGMRDDTEMNIATLDPELAHGLRLMLQAEHLGLLGSDDLFALSRFLGRQVQAPHEQARAQEVQRYIEQTLGNPFQALTMMHTYAWQNLQRYKANQPLVGHLLPYLLAQEALEQGLRFHEEHGWIEDVSQTSK